MKDHHHVGTYRFVSKHNRPLYHGLERQFGYGDLDDWNALQPADQERIRSHSVKLFNLFRPTKLILHILGIFPFSAKKLADGSYTFNQNRCSIFYILLLTTSMILCALFILFTVGFVLIFVDAFPSWNDHDRCGNTWGKTVISRNLPAVIYVWSQLMLAAAGSVYMITHSSSYLEFYNVVNESVMQMDVDATEGLWLANIRGSIIFVLLFIGSIITFSLGKLYSLEEVAAFVTQCILYFYNPDIYKIGSTEPFTAEDYEDMKLKCNNETLCQGCYKSSRDESRCTENLCYNLINTPTTEFRLVKWGGFTIFCYSILASWAIIHQFEFFCQVLVNLSSTWNKRFLNYASRDNKINMDDPFRRRITDHYMLKDHFQIVKLYKVAEENFSEILFVFFASVFFNMICQMYYAALLTTQVTCVTALEREEKAALEDKCSTETREAVLNLARNPEFVSFEDACSIKQSKIILHSSLTTIVLLLLTMTSFITTTLEADRASHQADVGFYRVRRKGYLSCRTKKERNAMHSLVFSFTGPKPFAISAAGYFPVRKKTIIVLTAVAFIYFLIILSFKPGMNESNSRCHDNNGTIVVKYPKVI